MYLELGYRQVLLLLLKANHIFPKGIGNTWIYSLYWLHIAGNIVHLFNPLTHLSHDTVSRIMKNLFQRLDAQGKSGCNSHTGICRFIVHCQLLLLVLYRRVLHSHTIKYRISSRRKVLYIITSNFYLAF